MPYKMSIDFAIKESLLGLNRDKYRTQGPLIMRLLDSDARTSSIIRGNSFPQQRALCKIYSQISRDARLQTEHLTARMYFIPIMIVLQLLNCCKRYITVFHIVINSNQRSYTIHAWRVSAPCYWVLKWPYIMEIIN